MADKTSREISVLGTRFTLQTDEDPDHLDRVLALLQEKIDEVEQKLPTSDPLRTAILSGILLADEVLKNPSSPTERERAADAQEAERLTHKMLRLLDGISE
jgi:cell division protein ZapA (FtsZ GTPase activity inhibitor)